jgi:hypothetical protein
MDGESSLKFLNKDNYCWVCAKRINNKKLKFIIETQYFDRLDYRAVFNPQDPIIEDKDHIFCRALCYYTYIYKKYGED